MTTESLFSSGKLAWRIVQIDRNIQSTGELAVLEFGKHFDFSVNRVFFLRNISAPRGFHSHDDLKQVIFCLTGSFDIVLDTGISRETLTLKDDGICLYVDGRVWREMHNFSQDATMVVLCDREYKYDKVVRCYDEFKQLLGINDE